MWNDRVIEAVCQARGSQLDLSALEFGRFPIGGSEERRQTIAKLLGQLKYRGVAERDACAEAIEHAVGACSAAGPTSACAVNARVKGAVASRNRERTSASRSTRRGTGSSSEISSSRGAQRCIPTSATAS